LGSLLEEAAELMSGPGPLCLIAILKQKHPKDVAEIDELISAVRDKTIFASKAGTVLRKRYDTKISDDAIRRHGHRLCQCH
jgi:hypothetical protein